MAIEYTLAMVKPDAVSKGSTWHIIQDMASSGLRPVAVRMTRLSKEQAKTFYAVHAGKKFFEGLTDFMSSGPIVALVLEGENAIPKYRELMGSTDSKKAAPGTLRQKFGTDVSQNAVHGSDSPENVLAGWKNSDCGMVRRPCSSPVEVSVLVASTSASKPPSPR